MMTEGEPADVLVFFVAHEVSDEDREHPEQREEGHDGEDVAAEEAAALRVNCRWRRGEPACRRRRRHVGLDEHVAVELLGAGLLAVPGDVRTSTVCRGAMENGSLGGS